MKKHHIKISVLIVLTLIGLGLSWPAAAQNIKPAENNDFYDNVPFKELPFDSIEIAGEVTSPGRLSLKGLPLHQVMVREAVLNGTETKFIGAYVYQGYSLFDILKDQILAKKNKDQFSSPIDLMVIVENKKGEQVIFSWGEIFYPTVLHSQIIGVKVAPIIPSSTGETWPLPTNPKIVAANDLFSERNLDSPVKITVKSFPLAMATEKGKKPLFSPQIKIYIKGEEKGSLDKLPQDTLILNLPAVFFGRGQGFHGVNYFQGVPLRLVLEKYLGSQPINYRTAHLVIIGDDGYRAVYTASEIFNRNDNQETIICDRGQQNGGRFSLFSIGDFFSDRAVKAIKEIRFIE